ncbi:MAG: hypothetical protein B6V02_00705 [Thermoprotei archaeon ex4572_64]|nr:MAG: hypothetical protein B6V02_00705 [Thermoprotei archaeon ex4572_64]
MKLCFLIGYGGSKVPILEKILKEESSRYGFKYSIHFIPTSDSKVKLDICKLIHDVKKSDVILIYAHDLPSEVIEVIKNCNAKVISIQSDLINLSNVNFEVVKKAKEFFIRGGLDNLKSIVRLMLSIGGFEVEVPHVIEIPWHGIYHPDYGVFTKIKDYLRTYRYRDRLLVGILYYRSCWVDGDYEPFVKLIKEVEANGLGVIPVFTYGHKDPILNTPSKIDSCLEFFMHDGKVLIDVLLDFTSFFFTTKTYTIKDFEYESVDEVEIVRRLNVPIIRPVRTWYQTRREWLESEQGIDYMSQVYQVIMPEVDGLVEPIVSAATLRLESGIIIKAESIDEHIKYLVQRIKKWIRLRRKESKDRKIAIILINPPCKGLEANVAVGLGLDVPESVVYFLKKLKERGYRVENEPSSGKELIKLILERKALSDFRWTTVEDIVRNGGVLDFVDYETYIRWLNELSDEVKSKMIKDWGHPKDVLEGKVRGFAGMVYSGKFVIPGLKFGNVVILPQPKFGCAGPRCDGQVCKVLHDPTITPPHQWLAVYRWITRIFDADVIIHFGTHGYLEFRPGKSVGLSWKCWPEISIDDTPHLYVYVVSNPMEGVIAKRRSYAVLIDHMYPAMSVANILEDLEELISQYVKAKNLGEYERAKVILDMILSKARENNIEVRAKNSDEIIEELHRYIDKVRSTQINLGLHVLGNPPRNEKLARHVVTALMHDSPYSKSIIRTLVEYLGYDYDKLRKGEVKYIPELEMTSSELLNRLYEISIEIIHELLMRGSTNDNEILSTIRRVLKKYNLIRD